MTLPGSSQQPPTWRPVDLDLNRDLAEQLFARDSGRLRSLAAAGSRGTSAGGTDVYNLDLELRISPPFPTDLKLLKDYVASYQVSSGVKVLMRVRASD